MFGSKKNPSNNPKNGSLAKLLWLDSFFILFFIALSALIISAADNLIKSKTEEVLKNRFEGFINQYQAVNHSFMRHASYFFKESIDNEAVFSLYREIASADEKKRDEIRRDLHKLLGKSYENLAMLNFRQLHFQTPDNHSFLRFHKPDKYDDDLTGVRYSIEQANRLKRPISGFEEGRVYNGFRNVFPLIDKNGTHLGSVEVSVSYKAFKEEIARNSGIYVDFMIKKELVNSKVWEEEQKFYEPSNIHDDYLSEKQAKNRYPSQFLDREDIFGYTKKLTKEDIQKITEAKSFATYLSDGKDGMIAMFLPVANVEGDVGASYLHAYIPSNIPLGIKKDYWSITAVVIFIIALTLLFIRSKIRTDYKIRLQKEALEESEAELRRMNLIMAEQIEYEVASRINAERLYRTLFENSPMGVLSLDEKGCFIHANKKALELIGYSMEELAGKSVSEVSPDIQPDTDLFSHTSIKDIIEAVLKGEVRSFEWAHTRKDGKIIFINVLLSVSPVNQREIMGFWQDITEIKSLENEKRVQDALLVQHSKLAEMGEMIAAIAHQWKQPLTAISLVAQTIGDDIEFGEMTDKKMIEIGEFIKNQVAFMNQTINDFRNFLSPNKIKQKFMPCESITESMGIIKHLIVKSRISLTVHEHEHFYTYGIKNEFQQAMINIVKNAADVLEERHIEDKRIDVYIEVNDGIGVIKICDNGGGIPEFLLPDKLFDPYVTTKGEKGTGIGLQLVKKIIKEHFNGTIEASNIEGGACFIVSVPIEHNN